MSLSIGFPEFFRALWGCDPFPWQREFAARLCAGRTPDFVAVPTGSGKTSVWAACVMHVIARMNFLFDLAQPVHLTFDTICGHFQTSETTVGGKATEIERALKLRQHCEPGLCRSELMESFTIVRLSNGLTLSWKMAKQMG